MIDPLTIEAIAQACKGKTETSPAIVAALIALFGMLGSGIVTWLMNLSVKERGKVHADEITRLKADLSSSESRLQNSLARELKTHESALRVQADVRLRMHERSWELLRDLVQATQACEDAYIAWMATARFGNPEQKSRGYDAAERALSRVVALARTSPPGSDFENFSASLVTLLNKINRIDSAEAEAAAMDLLNAVSESATDAFGKWNTELWRAIAINDSMGGAEK